MLSKQNLREQSTPEFVAQEDSSAFDKEFPDSVNRPDLRTSFLISIRENSLAKLDRFKGRIQSLFNNYLRLEYLDLHTARDAIIQPVEQYNLLHPNSVPISIDSALIGGVLAQVKRGELILGGVGRGVTKESNIKAQVETPYLQLVMTQIWDEELFQNSCVLRLETLNQLGGANASVSTHLDRVRGNLKKADQATAAVFFSNCLRHPCLSLICGL